MGFGTAHAMNGATPMTPDLAFNTAVSFTTNTNWQNYPGGIHAQLPGANAGLTVQNFVSAATGLAVSMAVVQGLRAE